MDPGGIFYFATVLVSTIYPSVSKWTPEVYSTLQQCWYLRSIHLSHSGTRRYILLCNSSGIYDLPTCLTVDPGGIFYFATVWYLRSTHLSHSGTRRYILLCNSAGIYDLPICLTVDPGGIFYFATVLVSTIYPPVSQWNPEVYSTLQQSWYLRSTHLSHSGPRRYILLYNSPVIYDLPTCLTVDPGGKFYFTTVLVSTIYPPVSQCTPEVYSTLQQFWYLRSTHLSHSGPRRYILLCNSPGMYDLPTCLTVDPGGIFYFGTVLVSTIYPPVSQWTPEVYSTLQQFWYLRSTDLSHSGPRRYILLCNSSGIYDLPTCLTVEPGGIFYFATVLVSTIYPPVSKWTPEVYSTLQLFRYLRSTHLSHSGPRR